MTTWIFQTSPDRFDLEGFLSSGLTTFLFTARQKPDEMGVGDRVFIWRSGGQARASAGIVAEALIIRPPEELPEDVKVAKYWVSQTSTLPEPRVLLRLQRAANKKQILKRDWLISDPVLKELLILKMANQTNYRVGEEEARRLGYLWDNTGVDWGRDELIAGLWAFHSTHDGSVSKLAGSPVADAALRIGRAVPGVYNRVMNYRALDPTDIRTGMTGGGEGASAVWNEFFDPATNALNAEALEAEYHRLWSSTDTVIYDATKHKINSDAEAERLAEGKTEAELQRLWDAKEKLGSSSYRPDRKPAKTYVYERDPLVVALRKAKAGRLCENPACVHPLFNGGDGLAYVEVHHIVSLAQGGKDHIDNTACLCPACHVEAHRGVNREALKERLLVLRNETFTPS